MLILFSEPKMTKDFKQLLVCSLSLWLMVSCSTGEPTATVLPLSTSTRTSVAIAITAQAPFTLTPQPTGTRIDVQTAPNVTPTVSIFDSPEQITDGKLRLSIRESNEKCYKAGNFIPLTITYENLTKSSLTIVDYKVMDTHMLFNSQGQLFPVIATSLNERIFSPYDFTRVDLFNPTSPLLYKLPAKTVFEVSVEYYFWSEMVKSDRNGQRQTQPVPPGKYLLKLVYSSSGNENSWEGAISSNQITICIVD